MTISKSGSQVKYELLEENDRTAVKTSHVWLSVLLVILIVCSSIISFFVTWQHMKNSSKERDNMDFLMFGPTRLFSAYSRMSQFRGEMYGLAKEKMRSEGNWSSLHMEMHKTDHIKPLEYKRICYFSLPSYGAFPEISTDNIPPDLCTHIIVAFATVENGTIQPSLPGDVEVYKSICTLKKKNPKLKVLLSVEWFTSSGELAWVVSTLANRTRFVDSAVHFLESNSFDGLDIDWEFPSWPTVVENQTNCFTELLQHMSSSFRQREQPLILSVAVGAPKPIIDQSYNITAMSEYIDYVNVMAYDYHMYKSYLPLTGANSPLYQRQVEKGYFTTLNVNWTASYWLYKGMPASKIIIGIPTYGHSFTLMNEENYGWDAPSSGVGSIGSDGFIAYDQVCGFIADPGVHSVFDYESKVPYAFKHKEWISYENKQSVAYKAEFAKQNMFGGVMIFSLNTDDETAVCDGQTRFPLAERVKSVLQDDQL